MRRLSPVTHLLALVFLAGCQPAPDTGEPTAEPAELLSLTAWRDGEQVDWVYERTAGVDLVAEWTAEPVRVHWSQVGGPPVDWTDEGYELATLDLSSFEVASPVEVIFELEVPTASEDEEAQRVEVSLWLVPEDAEPSMGENVQLGGSVTAVDLFAHDGGEWMAWGVGNRLSVATVDAVPGADSRLYLSDQILDIRVVDHSSGRFALVALGPAGLAIVSLADPTVPTLVDVVLVDYEQAGLSFAEGGGDIITDQTITSDHASVGSIEIDDTTVWIGTTDYGLHAIGLNALLDTGGVPREDNGTLAVDAEAFILQYAGENPWGGPQGLTHVDGKLFVAQGHLGLGIYDGTTLERVGAYHLYTDASVVEDWYIDLDVATAVQTDPGTGEPYLDAVTGMPDYRQANFEIEQVWHGDVEAPTPWADFDRYGRNYYAAHAVDVASRGGRDIAYVAYGLGGLVAVDVTGFRDATASAPVTGQYLGYVPAVPAHGPDSPTGSGDTDSLYPHYGAGMLVEAGVVDVVVRDGVAWFSDHFAGLVALGGADTPQASWRGAGAPYDNDDQGVLGDHWPDDEFVTSFDMDPHDPQDNESLPKWVFEGPALLVTGEIAGHGGSLKLSATVETAASGTVDMIQTTGSGGLITLDILDFNAASQADRFSQVAWHPTTDAIGAAADGSTTQPLSIGHTQGVSASDHVLYVGDGPHGVSAWIIADGEGAPLDVPVLAGNTVQDEYEVLVEDAWVYPASHASNVVFDVLSQSTFSASQSTGLRRVPVGAVEARRGEVGPPLLLGLSASDLFEHNVESGNVEGLNGQDHAYNVVRDGDLAWVADGSNGLTVYDITKDPSTLTSGFFVGNIGGENSQKPPLGRATSVDLWTDEASGKRYAFVAAGQRGLGVVAAADPANLELVKVFEPIKLEDDTVGKADGRCVDVRVVGDTLYVSYSSFGFITYDVADLIEPLPDGVSPAEIWNSSEGFDHRPEVLDRIDVTELEGFEDVDYEFLFLEHVEWLDHVTFYVGAGASGVAVIDGTDPANLALQELVPLVGEGTAVTLANGRMYVADQSGGVAVLK